MAYVKDTMLVSVRPLPGGDGTTWKECVIAWEEVTFEPGQFLMVAPLCGTVAKWPSPLMIQAGVPEGFVVFVHPNSPLYSLREGDAVAVWGPNGKGTPVQKNFAALCDAKGLLLAAPLLRAQKDACRGLYLVGTPCADAGAYASGIEVRPVETFEQVAGIDDIESLVVALPLVDIARLKRAMPPRLLTQSLVFVGAKVGCGMGACRGCFIHSALDPAGVAVCQEGPFMPMDAIDYRKDQNALAHYI